MINCDNPEINTDTLEYCHYGIRVVSGANYPHIEYNTIRNMTIDGIDLDSSPTYTKFNDISSVNINGVKISSVTSNGQFYANDIDGADDGIFCTGGTTAQIQYGTMENCDYCCVEVDYVSTPTVTPYNTINRDGDWSIYNDNEYNTVNANANYWTDMLNEGFVSYKPVEDSFKDKAKFDRAKLYFDHNDYDNALESFEYLLTNYPESAYSMESLPCLMKIFESEKETRKNNYAYFIKIRQALKEKEIDNRLEKAVDMYILYWLERTGNYAAAEKKYDELLAALPEKEYQYSLKYKKALMYKYGMKDPLKAGPLFAELSGEKNPYRYEVMLERGITDFALQKQNDKSEQSISAAVKAEKALLDNYPNPFNPDTKISYSLKTRGLVKLEIFDLTGRMVKTLVSEKREAGTHSAYWNGRNDSGSGLASGTYIYRLRIDGRFVAAKKMVLLK